MNKKYKIGLLVALLIPCWVIALKYDIDLVVLHYTAQLTHSDLSRVYAYNGNLGRYFYGPTSLVLIWPLGALSYEACKILWIGLQTVSFVIFWKMLGHLYPWLREKSTSLAWITVLIVSINPIHNNYQSNNIQLMLMAAIIGAEFLRQKGTPKAEFWSGILIVVAASVKVFPAYVAVFYFLLFRRYLTTGLLVGALACVIAPFLWFGMSDGTLLWRDFLSNLTTYSAENNLVKVPDILSLPSLLARTLGDSAAAQLASKVTLAMVAAGALAFGWRHRKETQANAIHIWALVLFTMAFINPSTRPHYFMFYIPAYCSWLALSKGSLAKNVWIGVSVLLVAFTAEGVTGKSLNNWLEMNSFPTYGMVLLGVGLWHSIHTRLAEPSTQTSNELASSST